MKVSNAASPPQLEFLTHRSYCPSEMTTGGLLKISSSFWVSRVEQDIQEKPRSQHNRKQFCSSRPNTATRKGGKGLFTMWKLRVVRHFHFIAMLFQHKPIPCISREKKKKAAQNCQRSEVEQIPHQAASWETDLGKLLIWSSEVIGVRKSRKQSEEMSAQLKLSWDKDPWWS